MRMSPILLMVLYKKILLFHGVNNFLISERDAPKGEVSHIKLSELLRVTDVVTLES